MSSHWSVVEKREEQGAWIFLISLGVFFFSCVLLYGAYITMRMQERATIQPFTIPYGFAITTVNLLTISVMAHAALISIRNGDRKTFRRRLTLSFALSILFFVVQSYGLVEMMNDHLQPTSALRNLYGLTFALVIVHALHVVGGVAALAMLLRRDRQDAYSSERHFPVKFCVLYWHFLDLVWLLMLVCFAVANLVSKQPINVNV
ncbi:MAG: cytochrome c oxidase subunit 3 [Fuerstiella sp.]